MSNLLLKSSFYTRNRNVGIGPISLFALVIIVCMATLAMLTISTAHSSLELSQRQAEATQELYLSETAAQTFLADLDEMLNAQAGGQVGGDDGQAAGAETGQAAGTETGQAAGTGTSSAAQGAAVISDAQLVALRDSAQDATGGKVSVTARADGDYVYAEFACAGGRTLKITLAIQPDGTYQIERWKMTAVVNEEQEMGTLYLGD